MSERVPFDEAQLAWRAWLADGETLYGTGTEGFAWTPRRAAAAKCRYGCLKTEIPGESCACGLYAAKTLGALIAMGYPTFEPGKVCVLGQAACWGKWIEGSDGWRWSHAYPARLWVPFESSGLAKSLREAYGCEVGLKNYHDLREAVT